MLFFRKIFSYSPHLTLRKYSQTWSSVQFLTASGPSRSENSDSVGLAKPGPEADTGGTRRDGAMLDAAALGFKVVPDEASEAGKEDLEASMAMVGTAA